MGFDKPTGTRGARQPSGGLLLRMANKMASGRIRRSGKMMGFSALILTTIGAKSGAERSTPLGWFPGSDDSWLIVASAAGAARNPAWYHNLAAHPDQASIEVGGRTVPVSAEELHGPERDDAWRKITEASPRFAGYQAKTDRLLPVIRLTQRPG
jgi:deazaflavin-dependent oxidoreductase (nitroreductase family)